MDESYLTVNEVAAVLKINPQTIRNMIDRGDLPAVRVGARRVRIRQSDFDAFLKDAIDQGAARADRTFCVQISEGDQPAVPGKPSGETWSYEISAASADRAATIAIGRWRKEVGRGPVAQSLTVIRS